jgi:hypothetical protein
VRWTGGCVGCDLGVGFKVGIGVGFCVGVGGSVGVSVGSFTVGELRIVTFPVVEVGVKVVPTVVFPYTEAAQMQRRSAAIIVPHPRPIFVLRERVLNQCLIPDGLFGGIVYGGGGGY